MGSHCTVGRGMLMGQWLFCGNLEFDFLSLRLPSRKVWGGRGTVRQIPRQRAGWFGQEEGLSSGDTSVAKRV